MSILFLLILIFQNIILKNVPSTSVLNYWDESVTLVLFIIALVALVSGRAKRSRLDMQILVCTALIVIIGFIGSFIFQLSASSGVAFRDMVGFVKFPLTFVNMRMTGIDSYIGRHIKSRSISWLKLIISFMFVFAIISLFVNVGMSQDEIREGIRPFQFLFSHPTYLVLSCVMLLSLLDAKLPSQKNSKYEIMLLIIILLSMRTKGFAIVVVFLVLKYGWKYLRKARWLLWGVALIAVYAVSISKIDLYASYSGSPRESLYLGAITLAKMYFPIGSGFGTFGSTLSGLSFSKVYNFIVINGAWVNGQLASVLGDAGYTYYFGEFGIIGFILFMMMLLLIFRNAGKEINRIPGLILLAYVLLALVAESTLLNSGVEIGIILAVVLRIEHEQVSSKINSDEQSKNLY